MGGLMAQALRTGPFNQASICLKSHGMHIGGNGRLFAHLPVQLSQVLSHESSDSCNAFGAMCIQRVSFSGTRTRGFPQAGNSLSDRGLSCLASLSNPARLTDCQKGSADAHPESSSFLTRELAALRENAHPAHQYGEPEPDAAETVWQWPIEERTKQLESASAWSRLLSWTLIGGLVGYHSCISSAFAADGSGAQIATGVEATSQAVAQTDTAPSWLQPAVLAAPLLLYGLFYWYRENVNQRLSPFDYVTLLLIVLAVSNLGLALFFQVRLF